MYSILETTVYFVVLPAQHMFPTFQGLIRALSWIALLHASELKLIWPCAQGLRLNTGALRIRVAFGV